MKMSTKKLLKCLISIAFLTVYIVRLIGNLGYKSDKIKVIKVNGIEPSAANIRNLSYPFTTNYFGVIRSADKDQVGGKFLDWVLSDEGQRCVAQAGYCALR